MASVLDVATYILERHGPVSAMKLQKLCYYSQAWSLVWDEAPLFDDEIQAWANGPVVPALFQAHKGQFTVTAIPGGDSRELTQDQRETIDTVCGFYMQFNSQQLSDLTHIEAPWKTARIGLAQGERGETAISHRDMAEYYSSISNG